MMWKYCLTPRTILVKTDWKEQESNWNVSGMSPTAKKYLSWLECEPSAMLSGTRIHRYLIRVLNKMQKFIAQNVIRFVLPYFAAIN